MSRDPFRQLADVVVHYGSTIILIQGWGLDYRYLGLLPINPNDGAQHLTVLFAKVEDAQDEPPLGRLGTEKP